MPITRRHLVAASLLPALARPALGQGRPTLRVQVTSGLIEKTLREDVVPEWEPQHNATVALTVDDDITMLPKLQVARGRPPYDVVMMDGDKAILGAGLGLWAPSPAARLTNLGAIYESCKPPATANFGCIVFEYALVYRTPKFDAPPASWGDLWAPGLTVAVPHISQSYGMAFLLAAALLNGGDAANLDPGFAAIKRLPRFKIYRNVSEGLSLFQQGEVDAGMFYAHRAQGMIDAGLPVAKVVPREGSWGQRTGLQLPQGGANPELAAAWMDTVLGVPCQTALAKNLYNPANRECSFPPDLGRKLLLGAARVDAVREPPWAVLLPQRDAILDKWNREIAA